MKEIKIEEVTKKQEVVIGITCDTCEKEIPKGLYYEVVTGHRLWGRDSVDSRTEHEFCSLPCLTSHFNEYMAEEAEETHYYEIEIEKRR